MADDHIPVDDSQARTEADRTSLPSGYFPGTYKDAADHAADAARADGESANLPWIPLGPRNIGGRIRCLAQDPIDPDTVYAGAAFGGLWKTEDGGERWRPLNAFLQGAAHKEVAPPIGAIGICHRAPSHLFIGTGEPRGNLFPGLGLFFTDNGGGNLQLIDDAVTGTIASPRFERIRVDPWTPGRAWIACPKGLWRSTPGAPPTFTDNDHITVSPIPAVAPPAPEQDVTDVAIHFGDRDAAAAPATFTVYAAIRGDAIYRAAYDTATNTYLDLNDVSHPFREAGAAANVKWKKLSGPFPDPINNESNADELLGRGYGRTKLTLCEKHPLTLYAIFCMDKRKPSEVFVTNDGGNTWTRTAKGPGKNGDQADYCLVLEVHPDRPEIAITGTVNLYRTVDGGQHWETIIDWNNYDLGDRGQHADQHAVLFDRLDPRKVWVGNDGGISLSTNLGASWRVRSHGILAIQFYDVTNHPTYPFIYGGGFQDNGSWVSFGGPSWHRLSGGDGGAMAFQHGDPYAMLTTWQGRDGSKDSLNRIRIAARTEPQIAEIGDGLFDFRALYDFQQSKLPDLPGTGANGGPPFLRMVAESNDATDDFDSAHRGIFGGRLEGHPAKPDHWIMARQEAAYASRTGSTLTSDQGPVFDRLQLPRFARHAFPSEDEDDIHVYVSAIAYAPAAPDTHWWIATSRGEIFRTDDGGGNWDPVPAASHQASFDPAADVTGTEIDLGPNHGFLGEMVVYSSGGGDPVGGLEDGKVYAIHARVGTRVRLAPTFAAPAAIALTPLAAGAPPHRLIESDRWITDIQVHPANNDCVVVTTARGWRPILMTGDGGATWRQLRGVAVADRLFSAPVTRAVFDPRGPGGVGPGDLQTVYISTFAGVYVSRNITPDSGGPDPVWRTLNTGMPLVLVRDLAYGEALDAGGNVVRRFLRAATYGRGAYQMELGNSALGAPLGAPTTPDVRLLVRSTPIDDGHHYFPPQRLTHDPRAKAFDTGTPRDLTPHLAFDIRVDAPPFTFFERILDGAEFDEEVRSDNLVIGKMNLVYVQVHNTGFETVNDVFVHLYFADASVAPNHAPDLDAGFWGGFPNPPAAGATWRRAIPGGLKLDDMGPAQPRIARFEWTPPIELGQKVALLALVTHGLRDSLPPTSGNLQVDPQTHGDAALVVEERRAALRIVDAVPFVPDLFVRDAVDDDGTRGAVAWGGRSVDIVVMEASEANPDAAFTDPGDPRETDRVRGQSAGGPDVQNFIYVRVWNHTQVPLSTEVELYYVPYAKLAIPGDWVQIDDGEGNTSLAVDDIQPEEYKFSPEFVLTNPADPAPGNDYKAALLVAVVGAAEDPRPDIMSIDSVERFWRFFQDDEDANNAAFRGLRYVVEP